MLVHLCVGREEGGSSSIMKLCCFWPSRKKARWPSLHGIMDSGTSSLETRLDASFLPIVVTLEILFVGRIAYSGFMNRVYLLQAIRSCQRSVRQIFEGSAVKEDERLVNQQVNELRLKIARLFIRYLGVLHAGVLSVVALRRIRDPGSEPEMSRATSWSLVFALLVSTLVDAFPACLRVGNLNTIYVMVSLYNTILISPWHVAPEGLAQTSAFLLAFLRIPAVAIATSPALVVACNVLLPTGLLTLRTAAETSWMTSMLLRAWFGELAGLCVVVCAAASLQLVLSYRIERSLQYKKMASDFNAASSLLHLICDAVVELDKDPWGRN